MLPQHLLSSVPMLGYYYAPDNKEAEYISDYEFGGIALNDPSEGSLYQIWTANLRIGINNFSNIWISAPNTPELIIYSGYNITTVSLAFDQNMQPAVAYMQNSIAKLRWYNALIAGFDILELPAGSTTPRICLDDKRPEVSSSSDIILTYVRAGVLYFREQRDRFLVEYTLTTGVVGEVLQIGMTNVFRLEWVLGVIDYPTGTTIKRAVTSTYNRTTTQNAIRKVVGVSHG